MRNKIIKFIGLGFTLALLSACGGGGGGGGASTPPTTNSISGVVSGAVLQGVTITLSGTTSLTTTTDASGIYEFIGLADGSYTVSASLTGYNFNPFDRNVTISGASITGQNFTALAITYSISGEVTDSVGGVIFTEKITHPNYRVFQQYLP